MSGLKAMSSLVLTLLAVIAIVGVLIPAMSFKDPLDDPKTTDTITLKRDNYAMEYALFSAYSYSESALDYSVFNGLQTVLYQGGFYEIPAGLSIKSGERDLVFWYDSRDFSQDIFVQNIGNELESAIQDNLNTLTRNNYQFLENYNVVFPKYRTEAKVEYPLTVTIKSDSNLRISETQESGERITLEKNPEVSNSYDIEIGDIITEGKEVSSKASSGLNTIISEELSTLPEQLSQTVDSCGTASELENACISLLGQYTSKSDFETSLNSTLKERIISEKSVWEESQNYYTNNIEILDSGVQVLVEGDYSCGQTNTINCDFIYQISTTLKVVIDPNGDDFPVYTGEKVEFLPLKLVYLIREHQPQPTG